GLYRRAARLIPALIIWFAAPAFLTGMPQVLHFVRILAALSMIVTLIQSVVNFLSFANSIYDKRYDSKRRPIKGIIQAIQVAVIISGLLLAFSVVTEKPISGLMAGIGALSAVLMLVFRDPLMGLVSGFQISSNDMVRIGDWIEVPSQGADGDVIDISLLNVTVRNFDKTYVTFPIQSLTTSGFKNWRGMSEAGGRRIKRWLSIDATSVRFIREKDLQRFKSIDILDPYLTAKITDIQESNKTLGADRNRHPLNGRALTNLGVFRAYAKAYVSNHPKVKSDMTLLVRQLQSGPEGIPMEIYVFSADTIWADYENLQSDIFDHLFAALEEFDLKPFQNPTGADFRTLAGTG
ncbi:MAG: mechanosensitive ion channel, partial [Spirochaetaceae bacterium]|nr:mechanosensitive ion channel [Spirochaetaceae bacterium]